MLLPHQVDAESGARLVGGELLTGTDAGTLPTCPPLLDLVERVARALRPRRVLLAGPLAADLRPAVGAAATDLLVRHLDDARALTRRLPGDGVVCGALDRLPPDGGYDLVVAVGGPELLLAPDSAPVGAAGVLALLRSLRTPGGVLVTDVTNPVGVDALVTAGGRPAQTLSLPRLRASLPGDPVLYSAYPAPGRVSALVRWPAGVDPGTEVPPGARAAAALAMAEPEPGAVPLRDGWDAVERLVDAGLAEATAPSWVVVEGQVPADLPPILAVGRAAAARGPLLESALRRACADPSRDPLRALVRAYAVALASDREGRPPVDARELVVVDGRVQPLAPDVDVDVDVDGTGRAPTATPTAVPGDRLAEGLLGFSRRLAAAGSPHRWSPDADAEDLTRELLAMVDVEAETPSTAPPTGAPPDSPHAAPGARAALADARRLLAEATDLLAVRERQVRWLEGTLIARDREVRTLQRAVSLDSHAYRFTHAVSRPVPALRRRLRLALRGRDDP